MFSVVPWLKKTRGGKRAAGQRLCAVESLESRLFLSGSAGTLPTPASPANYQTIDLLALYTPAAQNAAGGAAQMLAQIQADVNDANLAYANSNIYISLHVVAATQVNYTEYADSNTGTDDLATDLSRLQNPSDGYLDSVAALRNATGADLVTLYTAPSKAAIGGISYVMVSDAAQSDPWGYNADWAFSVVVMPSKGGPRYGLAHELGHNLGAGHADQSDPAAFDYAHGYFFTGSDTKVYYDIMAYAPAQSATRIPYFSNPNVLYKGVATGNATSADNARTLNQTAPVVAAYRAAVAKVPPNLAAYQPQGWSAALVVNATAGSFTADATLYPEQNLYLNWAFYNANGWTSIDQNDVPNTLYLDGSPILETRIDGQGVAQTGDNYYFNTQYDLGQLSPGAHTLTLRLDTSNLVPETDESDNTLSTTFSVRSLPNIEPYQPAGWSSSIVVSRSTGAQVDSSVFYSDEPLYVNTATANVAAGSRITSAFVDKLYIDGRYVAAFSSEPSLINDPATPYVATTDYAIGRLSVGQHTIRIETDAANAVNESNETDNVFTRTIDVVQRPQVKADVQASFASNSITVTAGHSSLVNFGNAYQYQSLPQLSLVVQNSGTAALNVSSLTIPAGYTATQSLPATIAPGESATLVVALDSTQVGVKKGTVSFSTNDPAATQFKFPVKGQVSRRPNLRPYKPKPWSAPIVVTSKTGTTSDSARIFDNQRVYIDFAQTISGGAALGPAVTTLLLDGALVRRWNFTAAQLNNGTCVHINDLDLGTLTSGRHTLSLTVDTTNAIAECTETDNTYTRTFKIVHQRDALPPAAALAKADAVTRAGKTPVAFTVTYSDDQALAAASIGSGDIVVTGPGHYSAVATLSSVSSTSDGASISATYAVRPPKGSWKASNNGVYVIKVVSGQVSDTSGNNAPQKVLGTFSVNIMKAGARPPQSAWFAPPIAWFGPPGSLHIPPRFFC